MSPKTITRRAGSRLGRLPTRIGLALACVGFTVGTASAGKKLVIANIQRGSTTPSTHPIRDLRHVLGSHSRVDILTAPQNFIRNTARRSGPLLNENQFKAVKDDLKRLSEQHPDTLLMPGTINWFGTDNMYHNTALAYAGGEQVHRYDMRAGSPRDGRIEQYRGVRLEAGKQENIFTWRGRRIGVEIGRDHLTQQLVKSRTKPDIQVVLSSGLRDGIDDASVAVPVGKPIILSDTGAVEVRASSSKWSSFVFPFIAASSKAVEPIVDRTKGADGTKNANRTKGAAGTTDPEYKVFEIEK